MIITDVVLKTFLYDEFICPDSNGHLHPGPPRKQRKTLLEIQTDEGVSGYAFGGDHKVLESCVKPMLVGEDPLNREKLWQKMRDQMRIIRRFLVQDLHVADSALWDLAGRYFNQPVYRLIGAYQDAVPAYASTMCGDDVPGGLSSPEDYASFALACRAKGYTAFKMHLWVPPIPGTPDWKKDLEACAAVRDAVGDTMKLMVDCCGNYTRIDAYLLGRELQKLDYYWIEEPMNEAEVPSYIWLANNLDIPVLGPEIPANIETRAEWIQLGAADILRCGAMDVGGITPLLKAVHTFETFGVPFDIHMTDPGNLQVLGATKRGMFYERGLLHPNYDYETPPAYLNAIYDPIDENGLVHISDLPGLGLDINFSYITENTVS